MKPRIHKSQLQTYSNCPMQFYFRWVENIIIPPGSAILVGKSVHASAQQDLTAKRDTGALLPLDAVTEAARDSVNSEWDKPEGVTLDDDEKLLGEQRVRGETVDAAVSLASLHHGKLAPALEPKHIERPFTVELNGFPVDISGTLDLQEINGTLRDLKTRSATPPAGLADSSLDLTFYGLAAQALDREPPPVLALDCLVKTKTPKLVTQTTTRGEVAYRALLLRIAVVAKAIESGIFPPCSPEHWMCSEKFCGYFGMCDWGRKARVQI